MQSVTIRNIILFFLMCVAASGCRHHAVATANDYEGREIRKITFKGNSALTDTQLQSFLPIQRGDHFITEDEAAVFDILLQAYASYGYYEARIVKLESIPLRRNRVDVNVHILEGKPVRVGSVNAIWDSAFPDAAALMRTLPLKTGAPASIEALNKSTQRIKDTLASKGYALAEVHESMNITQSIYRADVIFRIHPGKICRIGGINIQGLQLAPHDLVMRELTPFEGEVYTPEVESRIETALNSLNAFRIVTVEAMQSDTADNEVDVTVSVVEADFQSLKLGVGVQFETNKFLGWTSAVYQHNNFLHRLNQFQLRASAGWALVPALWNVEEMGPVTLIEPSVTRKGFLEPQLYWNLALALQTDVEENYKLFSPSFRPSVSRTFFERLHIRLGYNLEYIVIYGLQDLFLQEIQRQYEDMRSPIRLADINVSTRLSFADNPTDPNNGVIFRFNFWHSGKYLGSEVAFNKIQPSVAAYWRPVSFFQLAVRSEFGFLYPINGPNYTGIRSNFFLGGYNTVRGWGGKRLAPWVRICVDAAEEECKKFWLGGKSMVLNNAEMRFTLSKVVDVVVFFDVGDVQYDTRTIVFKDWNYSVGSGIRINTAIGKFRFDVGYRLNETPNYLAEPRFGIHLGLGEAF
ncbi:MAG: BamA/TamA family outer membrane protein [Deltaproteobacteria bacterium]|nr:BamA/TamA family outer membrane protein [Deltaproteobacteria bacterium]MBN2672670.1 BamA/TamA family outer membrane protein [Deltaproteobacteria bacterium]